MRFINSGFGNAQTNMNVDKSLLDLDEPVLRFYQWRPRAISLGRFQGIEDIDQEYCKENGIDIVRRITGGAAVLHDRELTYCFVIDKKFMPRSVVESYKIISAPLIDGLKEIGIKAEMNAECSPSTTLRDRRQNAELDGAVCFASAERNEILVDGKKIIGSAQRRIRDKVLQHGSILIDVNFEVLGDCFKRKPEIHVLQKSITSIKRELDTLPKIKDLIRIFVESFYSLYI